MSRKAQVWSLAKRMRQRLFWVTCLVTILTSVIVGYHYGSDISDLRQRKVLEHAERISFELSRLSLNDPIDVGDNPILEGVFNDFPDAYGWRVFDSNSNTVASSSFDWSKASDVPRSDANEWTHKLSSGAWVAGKRFNCNLLSCEVQVIAVGDPAHRLFLLVLNEISVHIIVPIVTFAVLMLLASRQVVDSTLKPLIQIQKRAQDIKELKDVQPIEVDDAPLEVRELTIMLNAALDRLKQVMDRERQFILDAAHTLRTPLAALKADFEVYKENVDLPGLQKEIDSLVRLSEQLLTSALADRVIVSSLCSVDAEQLIADVVTRLDPLARKAGVNLAFERLCPVTLVPGESDALTIALINLVENAIQHSPRGSEVVIALEENPLRISVRDSGPGIPAAATSGLITPFARGPTKRDGGAGLGLSIAHRIMEAHGGRLELLSATPNGLLANLVF